MQTGRQATKGGKRAGAQPRTHQLSAAVSAARASAARSTGSWMSARVSLHVWGDDGMRVSKLPERRVAVVLVSAPRARPLPLLPWRAAGAHPLKLCRMSDGRVTQPTNLAAVCRRSRACRWPGAASVAPLRQTGAALVMYATLLARAITSPSAAVRSRVRRSTQPSTTAAAGAAAAAREPVSASITAAQPNQWLG